MTLPGPSEPGDAAKPLLLETVPVQHVYTHPSPVEHWRHVIEIIALSIAAVWTFYVFAYQERIKPSYEPPSLDMTPSLEHVPLRNDKLFLRVRLPFKNISPADAQFIGVINNVYGLTVSTDQSRRVSQDRQRTVISYGLHERNPVLLESAFDRFIPAGGSYSQAIAAQGEIVFGTTLAVFANHYDEIETRFAYCYERADNRAQYTYAPRKMPDGAFDQSALMKLQSNSGVKCAQGAYSFPL